jgi:hypothetical protein
MGVVDGALARVDEVEIRGAVDFPAMLVDDATTQPLPEVGELCRGGAVGLEEVDKLDEEQKAEERLADARSARQSDTNYSSSVLERVPDNGEDGLVARTHEDVASGHMLSQRINNVNAEVHDDALEENTWELEQLRPL